MPLLWHYIYKCVSYIYVFFSEVNNHMFLMVRGALQGSFRATFRVASVFVHVVS